MKGDQGALTRSTRHVAYALNTCATTAAKTIGQADIPTLMTSGITCQRELVNLSLIAKTEIARTIHLKSVYAESFDE